ncbi:hypothetical protein [Roseibium marinum]|uniref:Uncharacterized protein n=1 Tax=Roseibium marinum TaxID=281252 RepID=A0A2S3UPT5_9HYPH|nr:hypothetical protein [Roseibium marinum]POF29728.1 hypothetical protein CLV41_108153 [Roseibium marinum]
MRKEAGDGREGSAERIGDTVKDFFASDRSLLSHPKDRVSIAQSQRQSVLMMGRHHLHRNDLILNDAAPGEMHLQLVHTAKPVGIPI